MLSGYKLNNVGNYDKYIIEEKIEIPEEKINLLTTTENFGQWIIYCFDKFDGFENATFHYDINGHDFMQTLQTELYEYIGYKIKMFKAIKHKSTLNKDAGLNNRVTWMRNLLSKK